MPGKISTGHMSIKHEIIDRANSKMLIAVASATFVFVFSIFASKALISQSFYHGRITSEKEIALKQLKENQKSLEQLSSTFDAFQSESLNLLGGNPSGEGPLDGNNAKLILDALPDSYDYPALSSSIEKILRNGGYEIGSIGGVEDSELLATVAPVGIAPPIEVPYSFTFSSNAEGATKLLQTLEKSIRPMYVDNLLIGVTGTVLETQVGLHTFFTQPKTFQLGSREVK